MLSLDQARAYRFSDELITLVEAVVNADPADESRSIEWKEKLDLTNVKNFTHLPHTILGFANRDPTEAAREFGGYGYLVVGAEPGNVAGITPMDPSDLVAKVQSYVGDLIIWHPSYVTVQGKPVLVIAVEPPRPGDAIHPLHKTFNNFAPGTIFTREPGRTVIAGVERQAMLQRRLLASTGRLDLTVSAATPAIEAAPDVKGVVDRWYDREHARLASVLTSNGYSFPAEEEADSSPGFYINPALRMRDRRSQEDYEREIERYLTSGRRSLTAEARRQIHLHPPAMLRLRVANATNRHFRDIQLVATVQDATSLSGEDLVAIRALATRMPRSPVLWGQDIGLRGMDVSTLLGMHGLSVPTVHIEPAYFVESTANGTEIDFRQFDLRTGATWVSPAIPLMTELSAKSQLEVKWHITADDADGRLEGALAVEVTPSTLDLTTLGVDDDGS